MALVYMEGFGNIPNLRPGQSTGGTPTAATGRDGLGTAVTSGSGTGTFNLTLSAAYSHPFVGVGHKVESSAFGGTQPSASVMLLRGDNGATFHLTVNWDAAGRLQVRRGSANGTVIATSTHTPVTSGSWVYVEAEVTIADAGGICKVRLNGVEVISFTGDTKNAGTNTSIDVVTVGMSPSVTSDDFYVCDNTGAAPYNTFLTDLGDPAIRESRPNGNGATNQWVGSDGNSTDNHLQVDEFPYNTTDYNGSGTAGQQDLYTVANVSGATTVLATQVHAYSAKTDAGARSIKTLARSSVGTVAASSAVALSTTYSVVDGPIATTDPDAAAWTQTSRNATQFGVEVV